MWHRRDEGRGRLALLLTWNLTEGPPGVRAIHMYMSCRFRACHGTHKVRFVPMRRARG